MSEKIEDVRITIGLALKQWIENSQYSKADIARILEVSPQYVNGLCAGKPIGKGMAKKLANQFGLSEYYLLTGEGTLLAGDGVSEESINRSYKDTEVDVLKKQIEALEDTIKRQKQIIEHYESFVDLLTRQNHIDNGSDKYVSDGTIQANIYDRKK